MKTNKVLKNKRGFTLVELIVSIAVIVIISVTALGVCASSIRIFSKTSAEKRLMMELNVYITCFETDDFVAAAEFAKGITLSVVGTNSVYYTGDMQITTEEKAVYKIEMTLSNDGSVKTFTAKTGNVSGVIYYEMPKALTIAV